MSESQDSLLRTGCNYCGNQTFIKVAIRLSDEESEFPYTETNFCKEHWDEVGINGAWDHWESIKEVAGLL
jgi:ArsR family metal-binding transcriptional regulator